MGTQTRAPGREAAPFKPEKRSSGNTQRKLPREEEKKAMVLQTIQGAMRAEDREALRSAYCFWMV